MNWLVQLFNYIIELINIPECVIKTHYQVYCPGCGSTRALRFLLQGDFLQSFVSNPLVIFITCNFVYKCLRPILEKRFLDFDFSLVQFWGLFSELAVVILYNGIRLCLLLGNKIDILGDIL